MENVYEVILKATINDQGWEKRFRSRAYIILREAVEQHGGIVDRYNSYPPANIVFMLPSEMPGTLFQYDNSTTPERDTRFEGVHVSIRPYTEDAAGYVEHQARLLLESGRRTAATGP